MSSLKTYIQATLYGFNRLYSRIYDYMNTYMHVITINEKRTHEFGGWVGVYGRVWREERKERDVINFTISKIKKI